MQAALAVDRRNKQRDEYKFAATVPAPPVIDLTEPEPELVAIVVDTHEPEFVEVVDHQPARPLRLTVSSAGNRRRWSRRDA